MPYRSHFVAAFVLVLGLAGARAAADDATAWPQFKRDSRRTGDNPGAALNFPLQRTTAVRFPAPIYASPAVVQGRVYIQDARGHVACIDGRRNQVVWVRSIGGINNFSSPAVADGKVYVGSTAGAFFVLDAGTGAVLKEIPAEGGVLAAPALTDDAVYFSTFAGQLMKIDRAGNLVWTFNGGRLCTTELAVYGREILFMAGSTNTQFYRLQDDGDRVRLLSKEPAPSNCMPQGGPVYVSPIAYAFQSFDSEYGRFYYFRDEEKPALHGDVNDSRVTPSVRGTQVYRGDKCFDVSAGLKLAWRADPAVLYDGGIHSSPALARDVLAVGSEQGVVHFFALEGGGKVRLPRWQFRTLKAGQPNSAVSSSPAVVDGNVYFGGEDGILYGLGKGEEAAIVDLPPTPAPAASARLQGSEWVTPGGDMGFSCVSADRIVQPPFRVEWQSRVWSTYKAPMVVADGKVFCGGRLGPLLALDAATGAILWKTHHPGVESRPAPTYADGKLVLLRVQAAQGDSPYVTGVSGGPPGEGLWCHDAATGQKLWHRPLTFKYQFNHDGLVVHDGKVFVVQIDDQGAICAAAYALETGREVWRQPLPGLLPADAKRRLPPRFSSALAEGLWCVSISDQATLGLDPATGKVIWTNREAIITRRTRIGARNGVVVVFNDKGDQALDPKTGKPLWTGAAPVSGYSQALTDLYLESKGQKGLYPSAVCAWPVHANGFWYSHNSFSQTHGSHRLVGLKPPPAAGPFLKPAWTVWSFDFLSNACPAPSPAYGRLYYSPNAEGVIYCFAPTNGARD